MSDLTDRQNELDRAWQQQATMPAPTEVVEIAWTDAVENLLQDNFELRRAREDVRRAHRQIGQVYRDLLPTPYFHVRMTEELSALDQLAWEDLDFNLNAFLTLSGLFRLPEDLYTARLVYLRSQLVYKALLREKLTRLRVAYGTAQLLDQVQQAGDLIQELTAAWPPHKRGSWMRRQQVIERQWREQDLQLQSEIQTLLGRQDVVYRLSNDDLPPLDYLRDDYGLENVDRVAVLARQLAATELLGAAALVEGAALRHWPRFDLFFSSPALFRRTNGQSGWLQVEDIYVSAGLYHSLDLSGRRAAGLADAKVDQAFIEEKIVKDQTNLVAEIRQHLTTLDSLNAEISTEERTLTWLIHILSLEGPESWEKRIGQYLATSESLLTLRRELLRTQAVLLFHDEQFWARTNVSPPASF